MRKKNSFIPEISKRWALWNEIPRHDVPLGEWVSTVGHDPLGVAHQISWILDIYIIIHNSDKSQLWSINEIILWLEVITTWGSVLKGHNIKKAEKRKERKAENHYSRRTLEKQRKTVLWWDQIYFYKKWFSSEKRFRVKYSAIPKRIALSIQRRKYSCTGEKEDTAGKRNQTLIIHYVGSRKRKKNYKQSLHRLYLTGHHLNRGKANTNRADISLVSSRMYSPISIWNINMTKWINQRTYSLYVVLGTYQVYFHDSLKTKISSIIQDKVFPIFCMNHS